MLKHEMEQVLYKIYKHEIDIHTFEQWLYKIDDKEVDKYFGQGFYIDLIDINYTGKFALLEVEKLICSKIPFNKFEKQTIVFYLKNIINDDADFVDSLEIMYDLYCKGYYFLRCLGLSYILHDVENIPRLSEQKMWDLNAFNAKRTILNKISVDIKKEANRILSFIETGKIQIIGEFQYEDLRKEEEKIEFYSIENMY